jgi:ATP-binding cassette subfamily B protein
MAIHGTIGVGTVVALTAYLGQLYGPLTSLSNVQVDVMTTLVSFERVIEVLDLESMIKESPTATSLRPARSAWSSTMSTSATRPPRRSRWRRSRVSPSWTSCRPRRSCTTCRSPLSPVRMVALVGPSGAGKTTIAGLVSRLYDPVAGSIKVGGTDLREATLQSIHDTVGVVSQDAHLFHESLRGNLLYAKPNATDAELVAALKAAQIWDVVEHLPQGLDTVVGDRGHRMSGGEKQRIAIARLLLKNPAVVVLDEATAHLDSTSEAAVQDALGVRLEGRTSIVIAHRLATIRAADQIIVVDNGKVVRTRYHDQLIALDGLYATLSRTQFAIRTTSPHDGSTSVTESLWNWSAATSRCKTSMRSSTPPTRRCSAAGAWMAPSTAPLDPSWPSTAGGSAGATWATPRSHPASD